MTFRNLYSWTLSGDTEYSRNIYECTLTYPIGHIYVGIFTSGNGHHRVVPLQLILPTHCRASLENVGQRLRANLMKFYNDYTYGGLQNSTIFPYGERSNLVRTSACIFSSSRARVRVPRHTDVILLLVLVAAHFLLRDDRRTALQTQHPT